MSGETNLDILLKNMEPVLQEGVYVFHSSQKSMAELVDLNPALLFTEEEGTEPLFCTKKRLMRPVWITIIQRV